jgi:hypothetical protein
MMNRIVVSPPNGGIRCGETNGLQREGVDAYTIAVEVDVMHSQMYAFAIVGRPTRRSRSGAKRVRSAPKNSGFTSPARRITINLTVSGDVAVEVMDR